MDSIQPHRSPDLLSAPQSLLVIVDVQERLLPHIIDNERLTANCVRLIEAAGIFQVPTFCSEQYPKGLGATIADIANALDKKLSVPPTRTEKLRFSAVENWPAAGDRTDGRNQVVVAGIETHICVVQTVFDLMSLGYRVWTVADATGSRNQFDRQIALDRMRDGGAWLTTTESVLFEWCEAAGTDTFKVVRNLVTGQ